MDKGFLYIAKGRKFIDEAVQSVKSLKKVSDAHVTLITDIDINIKVFDKIILAKNNESAKGWKEGILFKVEGLIQTPYKKTFFVDTDTYFCANCDELFSLLDYYDLLVAHSPNDTSQIMVHNNHIQGYYPYNTGVLVYNRNDSTNKLMREWLMLYKKKFMLYPHDQTPFMEALLEIKTHLYVLSPIYNFRTPYLVSLPSLEVKILHGRCSDYCLTQKKVNKHLEHRVWLPTAKIIYHSKSLKAKIRRLKWAHALYKKIKKN